MDDIVKWWLFYYNHSGTEEIAKEYLKAHFKSQTN